MEVAGKRLDDDIVSELCEPCQEGNVSTQADGYCNDCEEYMCQTCFQSHVKMKLGRNHVLGAVNAGRKQGTQSRAEKCKKHNEEIIKYYCRNHDSVGCGHCIVFDHRKCEPELIRDLAKNLKESSDFKNILKEVDELENLKTEIEVSLEKNRNENTEYHDKAVHGIQKYRAEINTWLDNITSKIEAEETEVWKENESELSKLEDWIKITSDMIDKVKDEINTENYTGENLFIRMIECKSEVNEFATKSVPEIKSSLEIKYFTFQPNQNLSVLTNLLNLGVIRVNSRNEELQTSDEEQQIDMTFIDGTSNKASSNLAGTESEPEYVGAAERGTVRCSEDPVRAELEKELENIRQTITLEKEKNECLQQSYTKLKKELENQVALLFKEKEGREKSNMETKELEKTVDLLKQEIGSLKDLNISQKSQMDSLKREFEILETQSKARQEQDQGKIISLQSELKKIRQVLQQIGNAYFFPENHEKECNSFRSQISELRRQREPVEKTYQLPDPRAAGFDVGKRVEHIYNKRWTGTVTDVDTSGYVSVKWDHGPSNRYKAGAGGVLYVKLL